jgi:hypothetical protein
LTGGLVERRSPPSSKAGGLDRSKLEGARRDDGSMLAEELRAGRVAIENGSNMLPVRDADALNHGSRHALNWTVEEKERDIGVAEDIRRRGHEREAVRRPDRTRDFVTQEDANRRWVAASRYLRSVGRAGRARRHDHRAMARRKDHIGRNENTGA